MEESGFMTPPRDIFKESKSARKFNKRDVCTSAC
jgi:hypothetical protein